MSELYVGPVEPWKPKFELQSDIDTMLESDDELLRAHGLALSKRCFVREFAISDDDENDTDGAAMVAVGDYDDIAELEFRHGTTIDTSQFTLGDCVSFGAFPGSGQTTAEMIIDGVRQVERSRGRTIGDDELDLFGSFTEGNYYIEAHLPARAGQAEQWTVRVYTAEDMQLVREETIPMLYEPVFGVDAEDKARLEEYVDKLLRELTNSD